MDSSPESFAGFSPKEITRKKCYMRQVDTPPLRIGKPRSSKSRAALVWKKGGLLIDEEAIKIEPIDENEATPIKSESETSVDQTDSPKKGKRTKKQKPIDSQGELVDIDFDSSKNVKVISVTELKKLVNEGKHLNDDSNNGTLEPVNSEQLNNPSIPSTSSDKLTHAHLKQGKIRRRRQIKNKGNSTFKCDQCGRKYKYLRGLRQHKKLECNKEPQFPCPYCPSRFRYRQNIREHVRNYHEQAFPKWYATHYVVPMLI